MLTAVLVIAAVAVAFAALVEYRYRLIRWAGTTSCSSCALWRDQALRADEDADRFALQLQAAGIRLERRVDGHEAPGTERRWRP